MSPGSALAAAASHLFTNYRRAPLAFSHGSGARLYDVAGREYLDFLGGIATSSLGHAHPRLVSAIADQAARVIHVSNLFRIPEQEEAARLLVEAARPGEGDRAPALDRVFFCNSGAEANEAAIKLARKWGAEGRAAGDERYEIVVVEKSFHGRTLGALAATGNPAYHRGFAPLPGGFVHVRFNDLAAATAAVGKRTCAVLVEPILGESGVIVGEPLYLKGLETLCRERGLLFMLDEVQTGIGRTGSMFAFKRLELSPDVVALAKGLGGGVPVGAVLARGEVAGCFKPGDHGSTFGGNPLACAAVRAVLETLVVDGLLERAAATAEHLRRALERLAVDSEAVVEVRGVGLMWAVELAVEAPAVAAACLERGLLINAVQPRAVRLLPPLVIGTAEVDEGVAKLAAAIAAVAAK